LLLLKLFYFSKAFVSSTNNYGTVSTPLAKTQAFWLPSLP